MAVQILEADAIGDSDQWILHAGASKVVAVQSPDDDDTTRIRSATNGEIQRFYVDKLLNADKVNQVDVRWRARDNNDGTERAQPEVKVGGAVTSGTDRLMAGGGAYTTWTDTSLARPGGGAWIPSNFPGGGSGTQAGVKRTNFGGGTCHVTSLRLEVDFSPLVGGFALFVAQWLPPLIAAASHGLLRREMVAILSSLKVRPSADWEVSILTESFRRRPVYAF